ncbi:MAG: acyl-CoA dehydratase activase [Brevinematia bacterium]
MNAINKLKLKEKSIGICLGACTFTLVEIENDNGKISIINTIRKEHDGDPKGVLSSVLDNYELEEKYIAITGRKFREITKLHSLIEPEATELAYQFVKKENEYDAIVSAGGETFIVYELDRKSRISRISSGNKCASGTGEFFLQQIRRMNITIEEAVKLAKTSENPHHLSGRCSVFCKSDCTHALNKGEPIENVTAGLARMIAKKIEELLVKLDAKRIMVVGGTSQNSVVIDFLRENFEEVFVPEEAPYFEALGAALWALREKTHSNLKKGDYFKEAKSSFTFLKPISEYTDMVEFKNMDFEKAVDGDECLIGLDVGSTTTKAVLFRIKDEKILAAEYLRTNGNPIEASKNCYRAILKQLGNTKVKIYGVGVTGSGRYIAGLHAETDGIINEIIAHARAAAHFDPEVDTIFEIGGQDAKYTYLTNSVACDYAMNEACSAGTGSFLEESAYESLGIKMEDIADIALSAKNPPNFSDQCAAFISSDINTAFQEGISKENIVAGLVYSICINYLNRVKGFRPVGKKIFMQGGVCYNKAVPLAMAGLSGKKIIVPPHPGLMGAYGVALELKNLIDIGLIERKEFDLKKLAEREAIYGKSFICQGKPENCDRKCEINIIEIEGKKFPFGGACNKYYNQLHNIRYDVAAYNHVVKRRELLFERFVKKDYKPKENAPVVGLNRSFQINTLYPMFYTFFAELGCRVVLPEEVRQSGIDKGMTSYCLSGQVALGMFEDLLSKKPDVIFLPQIKEMQVSKEEEYRIEYQTTCMFVQGEPFYQRATFLKNMKNPPKMITPLLNFMTGYDAEEDTFAKVAVELGFTENEGRIAYKKAVEAQMKFFSALKEEGKKILDNLEKNPDKIAIVLFGRPYNAFAEETNKGVPFKFASRGVEIIPYDFLPYENEPNYRNTYWEMGQRIIKAARIVKRHPQLFGCYLTNFLCALDSIMVQHFRDLMGSKPSLTLEIDSHTADAGVNTRIEAFMDVIKNYLKVKSNLVEIEENFRPAEIELTELGQVYYIDSDGNKTLAKKDEKTKFLIPSMGDLFARSTAAVLRGLGWNAEPLPVCDREALELGKSVLTSKECLPIINIIGEMLKYIKYNKKPDEKTIIAMVAAGGCCRVGQYETLLRRTIEKLRLKNVGILSLSNDNGYAGLGISFRINMAKALYIFDILDDIRSVIKAMAIDREEGMKIFENEVEKLLSSLDGTSKIPVFKQLRATAKEFSKIKLSKPLSEAKYVGLVGEIFVRRDHFSLMGIPELLAENGFVMLDAPVSEWVRYTDFLRDINMYELKTNLIGKIEALISKYVQDYYERKSKKILAQSGLYEPEIIDIRKYLSYSKHIFPYTLTGEPGLSTGVALYKLIDKYCGVINVGPFGCMNSRMTEAVSTVEMTVEGKEEATKVAGSNKDYSFIKEEIDNLPFLSIECDGNPFSQIIQARLETFMMQADRLYEMMREKNKN